MKITIEVTDLIPLLKKAVPEVDELKLKAGLFDLILEQEGSISSGSLNPSDSAHEIGPTERMVYVASEPEEKVAFSSPPLQAEDAFSLEDVLEEPSVPASSKRKRDTAARKAAREFASMDSKELMEHLISQSGTPKKKNGQFTELGIDTPSADGGDFVVG